jgi:hypothetical protein
MNDGWKEASALAKNRAGFWPTLPTEISTLNLAGEIPSITTHT